MTDKQNSQALNEFLRLIDNIYKRPGMYLPTYPTLDHLCCFITGYNIGKDLSFFDNYDFITWLATKHGLCNSHHWVGLMNYIYFTQEEAFLQFPKVFKQYLCEKGLLDESAIHLKG